MEKLRSNDIKESEGTEDDGKSFVLAGRKIIVIQALEATSIFLEFRITTYVNF